MKTCMVCGAKLSDENKICTYCLTPIKVEEPTPTNVSQKSSSQSNNRLVELSTQAMPFILALKSDFVNLTDVHERVSSTGSGFIVDGGYVITNCHVIEPPEGFGLIKLEARFSEDVDRDGVYDLDIVAIQPEYDVAILKFMGLKGEILSKSKGLSFRTENLQNGEDVYTIGNPLQLDFSVNNGIISCHNRRIQYRGVREVIQISFTLNHGNSGGALLDYNNNVVGMTTFGYSESKGETDMCIKAKNILEVLNKIL